MFDLRTAAIAAITVGLSLTFGMMSAHAQYDRDGRYVPSPNGVPSDPSARPIPMYSGTPGGTVGTPTLPRSAFPPPLPLQPLPPRLETPVDTAPAPKRVAAPSLKAASKQKRGKVTE